MPQLQPDSRHLSNDDLTTIRQHTDWRHLFLALRVAKDTQKSREHDWWGKSPFKPDERTASFHINDRGWYCHATGQGGGPIELIQKLNSGFSCYDAGRWLLEHGISHVVASSREATKAVVDADLGEAGANQPIRQDLRPRLSTDHPEFTRRGIPPPVLKKLGAGYLERPPRKNGKPDLINRRLVFQIRGVQEIGDQLQPVILSHTGRATTTKQEQSDGKWWTYGGFRKSLELYHLDRAVLEDAAKAQAADTGHVVVVEGCFDVAKLVAAGIENVVATFGCKLSERQIPRFELLSRHVDVDRFLLFYDRDQNGLPPHGLGAVNAKELLTEFGFEVEAFDWRRSFRSAKRGVVRIPERIGDPCDFSVKQLRWLRNGGWI